MHLKKRLLGISKNEISAVSYCIQKIYELGFLWSTGHDEELNYIYQINKKALIKLDAERIMKHEPEKIYWMDLSGSMSKKAYKTLLNDIKKHAPRVHAKLIGKKAELLQRKKQDLEKLLEKAEKYLAPEVCFDDDVFNEFKQKMNYKGYSYHGTTFYCNSAPYYNIDLKCSSAKKAEALFNALASRFSLEVKENKIITSKKKDAWNRQAENQEISLYCIEGFKSMSITINPTSFAAIPYYTKTKDEGELYYTALTPIMIALSRPKLIGIMQFYENLGLKSLKHLWQRCETSFYSDKEYVRKRKHDLHEDLVERLHKLGSMLINEKRYSDFFKLASIANHAFDQGNSKAKEILYDCLGLEPDTYCMSNHTFLMKKEKIY